MNIITTTFCFILIATTAILSSCFSGADKNRPQVDYKRFGEYWYQGKAEINTYELQQYRYGEKRDGEAVLIFVTEDFSKSKHVKLDDPANAGDDAVKILKMNKTKKFITGIYPYSMMLSVFTPVYKSSSSLKVTASAQEWCGHIFTQLNLNGADYKGKLFSYFEQEGDQDFTVTAMPEDDLWNLIRLNPAAIPTGKVSLIPALLYQRLSHIPVQAEMAEITISEDQEDLQELKVVYEDINRTLKIIFQKEFPFEIQKWEEVEALKDGTEEVTTANRKAVKLIDYWTKNSSEDRKLREEIRLE